MEVKDLASKLEKELSRAENALKRAEKPELPPPTRPSPGDVEAACTAARRLNLTLECRRMPDGVKPLACKDNMVCRGLGPPGLGAGVRVSIRGRLLAADYLASAGYYPAARASMDVMGVGITGFNPVLGDSLNPLNPRFTTGGSSSGSAGLASLIEGLVALGSDAGGSVRIPAAYTGVHGLRLRRSTLPLKGLASISPSFESIGLISKSLEDLLHALKSLPSTSSLVEAGITAASAVEEGLSKAVIVNPLPERRCRSMAESGVCEPFYQWLECISSSGLVKVVNLDAPLIWEPEPARAVATLHEIALRLSNMCEDCIGMAPEGLKQLLRLGASIGRPEYSRSLKAIVAARAMLEHSLGGLVIALPTVTRDCILLEEAEKLAYSRRMIAFTSIANTFDMHSISMPQKVSSYSCGAPYSVMLSSFSLPSLMATTFTVSRLNC